MLLCTFVWLPFFFSELLALYLSDLILQSDVAILGRTLWKSPFTTCEAWKKGDRNGEKHILCMQEDLVRAWKHEDALNFLWKTLTAGYPIVVMFMAALLFLAMCGAIDYLLGSVKSEEKSADALSEKAETGT